MFYESGINVVNSHNHPGYHNIYSGNTLSSENVID